MNSWRQKQYITLWVMDDPLTYEVTTAEPQVVEARAVEREEGNSLLVNPVNMVEVQPIVRGHFRLFVGQAQANCPLIILFLDCILTSSTLLQYTVYISSMVSHPPLVCTK